MFTFVNHILLLQVAIKASSFSTESPSLSLWIPELIGFTEMTESWSTITDWFAETVIMAGIVISFANPAMITLVTTLVVLMERRFVLKDGRKTIRTRHVMITV